MKDKGVCVSYFVSVKVKKDEYKTFEVPREVYLYIKQLETAVKHPRKSKIKDLYPERFK